VLKFFISQRSFILPSKWHSPKSKLGRLGAQPKLRKSFSDEFQPKSHDIAGTMLGRFSPIICMEEIKKTKTFGAQ